MKKIESSHVITSVTHEKWNIAQSGELDCWLKEPKDSDDWNGWWESKFDGYSFLHGRNYESIYEVGCGPYAKNIERVCNTLGYMPNRLILEDPLLDSYLKSGKSVGRFSAFQNTKLIGKSMEDFQINDLGISSVDILICNNVLDHVRSVELCFDHIWNSLKQGGIMILGQDLTSQEDVDTHPGEEDHLHPIRIDEDSLRNYTCMYQTIFDKILPRNEGRNPPYHYGTFLFAGRKNETT